MSKKPRNPGGDLQGWLACASGSEAAKQAKKRRTGNADLSVVKPSRLARKKGRGR